MKKKINIGDQFEIEIKKLGINGEGIGYVDKQAFFVDDTIPEEICLVKVTEVYDKRIVASLVSLIKESPYRKKIEFPLQQACGAYQMQHLDYHQSLVYKRDMIIHSLSRYVTTKVFYKQVVPMIGMADPYHYRNKVSLPARKLQGKNVFGLYLPNSVEFVEIHNCVVHHQAINDVLNVISNLMDQFKFDAYIQKEKSGYVKSVTIRRGHFTGEIQVSFMLMRPFDKIADFVNKLTSEVSDIKSVHAFYTDDYKTQTFFSLNQQKLFGKETINERMNGQVFSLYPESFFQLNSVQAHVFYQKMVELADLHQDEIAIDAYAGSAPISHYISKHVKQVYAIEIEPKSVKSANLSLKRNKIDNVKVIQSDFGKSLKHLDEKQIDVMFFDPPRGGLGYQTIKEIIKYLPKKIIYGSCNPSTLAKDLEDLLKYYQLDVIVPIDMFPFTPKVESITRLTLKSDLT